MATSSQLFRNLDLQAAVKAGRWSSRGTFTSFYLRDLCPQADSIQKTGPVLATGEILGGLSYCVFCKHRVLHPPLLGSSF